MIKATIFECLLLRLSLVFICPASLFFLGNYAYLHCQIIKHGCAQHMLQAESSPILHPPSATALSVAIDM